MVQYFMSVIVQKTSALNVEFPIVEEFLSGQTVFIASQVMKLSLGKIGLDQTRLCHSIVLPLLL